MKSTTIIILTLLLPILFFDPILGKESEIDTLYLNFKDTNRPPMSFIPHKSLNRPKIGLALSGGGARGLAQIGVLHILEENKIPIDFIVGVSMGSVVGGLYAAGYSPTQIQEIVKKINWDEIIIDKPPRSSLFISQKEQRDRPILQIRFKNFKPVIPQSLTAGQKLSSILTDITMRVAYQSSSNFDNLKVPFRALACDLISGQKVLIKDGNLAEAMRASATFPLIFSPVQKDSMLLVDGGLINNIPVDEVREAGVDLVIAINTTSNLHVKSQLQAPWVIADQVTTIMQREKNKEQQKNADVLIQLNMENRKSGDFLNIDELIIAGREEANKKITQIKNSLTEYKKKHFPDIKYQISNFDVIGCSNDKLKIINTISSLINNESVLYDLYTILEQIYQLGIFSNVFAEIINSDSIFFHVTENPIFTNITIKGNRVFSDSIIISQIYSEPNKPINFYQSNQDLQNIIDVYRKNGYSLAQIENVALNNGNLEIKIDEGIISKIEIQGNFRTKEYVIFREFPLESGDIFNINKATEGINNIHSTDLFTNVSFEIKRNSNLVNVILKLQEKPFTIFRLSARYDSERKEKGFFEIADENILGSGNIVTFHGQYGRLRHALNLEFRADRIFRSFLTYKINLFHNSFKDYTYDTGKKIGEYQNLNIGFSFSVGQQIKRLGTISLTAKLQSIELRKISGYGYPTDNMELKTIAIQSIVDTQDKYPFPTKGKYYKFFYEVSSATVLNSQEAFFKLYSSIESYFTFRKRNTIHPKVIWGTSDLTPFSEQFRLGGLSSFYGLHENEYVGSHLFLSSLEYRYFFPFKIAFDFYWSIRFDYGATWKNAIDIKPVDIEQGIGTALSVNTLFGPLTIAYGRNSEGRSVAYFSAGFEF